jgi:hypothetical protein
MHRRESAIDALAKGTSFVDNLGWVFRGPFRLKRTHLYAFGIPCFLLAHLSYNVVSLERQQAHQRPCICTYLLKECLPLIQRLDLCLRQRRVVRDSIFRVERRHPCIISAPQNIGGDTHRVLC